MDNNLKFYVFTGGWFAQKKLEREVLDKATFPCFILNKSDWDDYDYKTTYGVYYYASRDSVINFGTIKILDSKEKETDLPNPFITLDEKRFFTLGPTTFYSDLKKKFNNTYVDILTALNDIIYKRIPKEFFTESDSVHLKDGFEKSLVRDSDSEKAFNERRKILGYETQLEGVYNFTFSVKLLPNEKKVNIPFEFRLDDLQLNRINILIGKNGSGKTQTLAQLAIGLTDKLQAKEKDLTFIPTKPSFGRCFSVSYSLFDSFDMPKAPSKAYMYFGLVRDSEGKKQISAWTKQLKESLSRLNAIETNRKDFLIEILSEILSKDELNAVTREFFGEPKWIPEPNLNKLGLSSGEKFLATILTNIVANIQKDTLLLLDEPETHLHPNAISKLIEVLHKVLGQYDAYAIIATHSPIILQQIPRRYVRCFSKINNQIIVKTLAVESFGSDFDTLNNEIFGINQENQDYVAYFKKFLRDDKKSLEDINEYFNKKLSLNASLMLNAITKEVKRDEKS